MGDDAYRQLQDRHSADQLPKPRRRAFVVCCGAIAVLCEITLLSHRFPWHQTGVSGPVNLARVLQMGRPQTFSRHPQLQCAQQAQMRKMQVLLSATASKADTLSNNTSPAGGSYQDSGIFAKAIVGGLTAVVNTVFKPPQENMEMVEARRQQREAASPLSPADLVEGLREDFSERGYLFTGEISDGLYDDDCAFTDPTISFKGLDTFQRNLASLQPILNTFLSDDRQVILRSGPAIIDGKNKVRAEWTMSGGLKILPWKPRIELNGATTFTFNPKRKGRIVRYDETWEISALEALGQLVRRGEQPNKRCEE
eukprot:gnl/TRDRNA2_/TRDRNA2_34502_c0_seq1.p1 gnl/TRDRNA2_/TRDRNA2_34502_c0~~gnl/TRDRNA2_/TRDRNA2_34502_c0_seq1.p1  ORF type:complete len:311 (+),score=47.61 gnl/TRDRNA2_/TRDRNA2_34502_c0_seq1:106-1038(+)